MPDSNTNGNGLTQKEMLMMVLEGQEKINERIDLLHEKVNSKMSRQEFSGYFVAISALVVLVNQLMQSTTQGGSRDRNNISFNSIYHIYWFTYMDSCDGYTIF